MQQPLPPEIHAINERARAAMKCGIALLEHNVPPDLREAVRFFDEAIQLRQSLPLERYEWIRYGLVAGWMNRGDALTRLGGEENLAIALRNYDEALLQLRELPMSNELLFKKRLAIAWLNRGVTLEKQGTADSLAKAVSSYDEAINAAQNLLATGYAEIVETLACAWMNRGNVLLRQDPPQCAPARRAVEKALALLRDAEREKVEAAEIALKARHILCQALAGLLADKNIGAAERDGLLFAATEAVDTGMDLARYWETRGAKRFTPLVTDLFRFGCRAYQIYQPHFLAEFLLENLDPAQSSDALAADLALHASAVEALWRSFRGIRARGFKTQDDTQFEAMLENLRQLRIADERLAGLRARFSTPTVS